MEMLRCDWCQKSVPSYPDRACNWVWIHSELQQPTQQVQYSSRHTHTSTHTPHIAAENQDKDAEREREIEKRAMKKSRHGKYYLLDVLEVFYHWEVYSQGNIEFLFSWSFTISLFFSNILIWLLVWLQLSQVCVCVYWLWSVPWVRAGGWQNPHLKPESLLAHQHSYQTRHSTLALSSKRRFSDSPLCLLFSSINYDGRWRTFVNRRALMIC